MRRRLTELLTLVLLQSCIVPHLTAHSDCVSSLQQLEEAVSSASEGETVVICDGDYTDWDVTLAGPGLTLR